MAMDVQVESPSYHGVRVDHPDIVRAIKNLITQGRRTEDIMRIVGMPAEVVNRLRGQMSNEKK